MKNSKGLTLIELVIVLGLIGIVLSIIFYPIIFSYKNFGMQNERTNIISSARNAMDYLTRQIRKSSEVEVVDNTLIIDSSVYKLENKTLLKDDKKVVEGIDELNINRIDKTISIEITIKDSKGKDHTLSSTIIMR